jgi:N-acetylglucosamine-6-phosphate deacetylase
VNKTEPNPCIDLQVNGYLGCDFSSDKLTEEEFVKACQAYLKYGATKFLPTMITSSMDRYKRNLPIMAKVLDMPCFQDVLPGLHLEGPFVSSEPGAVGAHNTEWTQGPNIDILKQLMEWADGKISLITIAADQVGADCLCRAAVEMGLIVSLGHHLATNEDLTRLYESGATLLTHLGNGMPNTVNRHENPFLAGLMHDQLIPMIIADGFHLPSYLLKGIIKLRGAENLIMTSDASPLAGLPPGDYNSLGNKVRLETNGRLHNPDKQCLVGSSFTLRKCIAFLKEEIGCSQEGVNQMVYSNPLKVLASYD